MIYQFQSVLNQGTTFIFNIVLKPSQSNDGRELIQHPFANVRALVIAAAEDVAILKLQLKSWHIVCQYHVLTEALSATIDLTR